VGADIRGIIISVVVVIVLSLSLLCLWCCIHALRSRACFMDRPSNLPAFPFDEWWEGLGLMGALVITSLSFSMSISSTVQGQSPQLEWFRRI
jgi:hypothetical protein